MVGPGPEGEGILHPHPTAVKPTGASNPLMYIVAIGWMFVVVCMAAAEAATSSLFGAFTTLMFYGVLPLALVLWLVGTPQRRRRRERDARPDTHADD